VVSNLESQTLLECYEQFIQAKANVLSPSTLIGYNNLKNNSLQDIMHLKINQLNNFKIQQAINLYASNHSPKSVRNCYGLLTAVLKFFKIDLHLEITLPQKLKTELYIPNDEEVKKLIEVSKNTKCYIPILLSAFGGMRLGEICALTYDDIKGNYITVNKSMVYTQKNTWAIKTPKTYSSNREIEIPQFVIDELKGESGNIVKSHPNSITTCFIKLLQRKGLPRFRFHDLRHYYVSSLHAINIPDKYIQAQGGWSTTHTLNNVYKHTIENRKSEFSNKVTSHFEGVFKQ
jgi:integrase